MSVMVNEELAAYLEQQTDRIAELGLGLSAHTIQGWKGQLERVKRFHQRFKESEARSDGTESLDNALAFFVFLHSLREWFSKWEKLPSGTFDNAWADYVVDKTEMRLIRDIANVTKHLTLTQKPGVDKNPAFIWGYDPFVNKRSEWYIYFGEQRTSLSVLMSQVMRGWEELLKQSSAGIT